MESEPTTPSRRRQAVIVSPWSSLPGTPHSMPQGWSSSRSSFPEAAPETEQNVSMLQGEIELWQSLLEASRAQLQVQRESLAFIGTLKINNNH